MKECCKKNITKLLEEIENILVAQQEYTAEEEQIRLKNFEKFLVIKKAWG